MIPPVALLQQHGDEARILSGGQSLIPMMKLRLARPGFLIDINRIPGLLSDPTKVATCVPGGRPSGR